MGERRDSILLVAAIGLAVLMALILFPSSSDAGPDAVLSTNAASPAGAKALYRTMQRLGIPVARREAPLADAGPVPRALAVLAPAQPLTPREVGNVLSTVRRGGTLLWVHALPSFQTDYLSDSLHLQLAAVPRGRVVDVRKYPWTAGIDTVRGFRYAFAGLGSLASRATPLLVTGDTLVEAFVAPLGAGRIVALSDPAVLDNATIAQSGVAPLVVRAGAAAARGDSLVFDEFHHGFHGGSVRSGVAHFLLHHRLGHVAAQWLLVGLLALVLVSVRMGAPLAGRSDVRRSPLEHVEALGQLYREASAVAVPRLLLLGGLARALGEPTPHTDGEAADLLGRVEGYGGRASEGARTLREEIEGGEGDILSTAMNIDRIREELGR